MNEKNRKSWNEGADAYSARCHSPRELEKLVKNPASAFHGEVFAELCRRFPSFKGLRVCVPSSGDNHAVFAFAILGARVTSCDIAEKQLINAENAVKDYPWSRNIDYIRADSMELAGVPDGEYDLVYTSNGVFVWIGELAAMFAAIRRVLKPGGVYLMCDIHPYQRPFDDDGKVIKPYSDVGPYESDDEVKHHWRTTDIVNALIGAGLRIDRLDELFAEKNYDEPFWFSYEDYVNGRTATREEVDYMYDWRTNPMNALPTWLMLTTVR